MAITRDELHQLLDRLPASEFDRVARFLRNESEARQRFEELLATAPIDDEPTTDEDLEAIAQGERDVAAGRSIRLEDLPPIVSDLLTQAKQAAAAEGITLREVVEDALRRALVDRDKRAPFRLRKVTFGGHGLQPGIADGSWERTRELVYEGRGG